MCTTYTHTRANTHTWQCGSIDTVYNIMGNSIIFYMIALIFVFWKIREIYEIWVYLMEWPLARFGEGPQIHSTARDNILRQRKKSKRDSFTSYCIFLDVLEEKVDFMLFCYSSSIPSSIDLKFNINTIRLWSLCIHLTIIFCWTCHMPRPHLHVFRLKLNIHCVPLGITMSLEYLHIDRTNPSQSAIYSFNYLSFLFFFCRSASIHCRCMRYCVGPLCIFNEEIIIEFYAPINVWQNEEQKIEERKRGT